MSDAVRRAIDAWANSKAARQAMWDSHAEWYEARMTTAAARVREKATFKAYADAVAEMHSSDEAMDNALAALISRKQGLDE